MKSFLKIFFIGLFFFALIFLSLVGGVYFGMHYDEIKDGRFSFNIELPFNNIANTVLSAENFEETIEKYGEKNKGKDETYYLAYANTKYIVASMGNYMLTQDSNELYQFIYGKTIKQLIAEGKELMKKDNMSLEEFKKNVENLDNNINEFNANIDALNESFENFNFEWEE